MLHVLIKHWISLFSIFHSDQKMKKLAGDIACQCRATLIQRVLSKTEAKTLSHHQMRGYVRAYATSSVESAIKQHNDTKDLKFSQISRIILEAKELLIDMVVCDMSSISPTVVVKMANAA
jgi:hypothetical protein